MSKITLDTFKALKQKGEPITCLTAYDAMFASILDDKGVEAILVGDSLGMVIQGHDSTVPVSMDDMCYHINCVKRGVTNTFIIGDMPYMSYSTPQQCFQNAARLMQSGANMVKLEGGEWLSESIKGLVERGIPVCAHLGLTPQSVDALGGYKVQAKDKASADKLLEDALAVEKAGASLLVLECVPAPLAARVTQAINISTIGIGAGVDCDGQVLVLQDMLGMNDSFSPKFVKNFMAPSSSIQEAIALFVKEVKSRQFPNAMHSFK